jgi:hypothetical protein
MSVVKVKPKKVSDKCKKDTKLTAMYEVFKGKPYYD